MIRRGLIKRHKCAVVPEGSEVLVADTVRGLCSGKGFLFTDRGEFVAKGSRSRCGCTR